MYDAIVVGARCAGSPSAMLLARAGYRVLLLDRAGFPSDTLSTHVIHQPGVAALARWGVLEAVRASGCPPLDRAQYSVGDINIVGCAQGVEGQRAGYAPRRYILDSILAEAATAAGAQLRENCRVTDLLRDETGRVIGVEGTHSGGTFREHAHLVVGADGMRSTVAQLAEAPYTTRDPLLTCAYYSYWRDVPLRGMELHEKADSWVAGVATHDNATLVLTYFPQSRFKEVRANAEDAHLAAVRSTARSLYDRLNGKERVERLRGTGDQQNFFRQAAGSGWALVGDAGHHKDSITARGITDAFHQAELLVRHLGTSLGDPQRQDEALQRFGEVRDEAMTRGYEATLDVAHLRPVTPQRMEVLRAIQSDKELTSIYFDAFAGATSSSALYTPKLFELLGSR